MAKTTEMIILPDSKFVCDSLHLAEQLGINHSDMLRSLRLASEASEADGGQSAYALSAYSSEQGKELPKYDLTFDHLITASMYVEKLKPKFREFLTTLRETEANQAAQLKAEAALLKAEAALLKTANVKLLEAATIEKVETDFGIKYVKNIPSDKKRVLWYDADEGGRRLVLASSLTFDELADILISQAEPKARGLIAASHALRAWTQAAKAAKAQREPIPTLNDFGVKTSFGENLLEALKQY